MRVLIYGMQSSGASTFALLLAQKPDCAAYIDVWAMYAAPAVPQGGDVLAKVVVTTAFPLELHRERFRPDLTLLFLRHPEMNYRSLRTKVYRHHCGFMEEKFNVLDRSFAAKSGYDAVFHYEDMIREPERTLDAVNRLGWTCEADFAQFRRPYQEIKAVNDRRYPEVAERLQYGMGNHHPGPLLPELADLPAAAAGPVVQLCPKLLRHYRRLMRTSRRHKWSTCRA